MCDHEGQECPGRSCRCVCMNCLVGDVDDEVEEDDGVTCDC